MKICFVGPANSTHIEKWCYWFSNHGHEIHIISFTPGNITGASIHVIDIGVDPKGKETKKIKYLTTGKKISKIICSIEPDVISVHYASSYGIAMALSGIKRYILSIWGSDIYDFPKRSFFHKALLKHSLRRATQIFSTSQAMAEEAHKYTNKPIEITPFGVDMELFNPDKRDRTGNVFDSLNSFVVGNVKALTPKYGIDYLIRAIAIIQVEHPDIPIKIRIAGTGSHEVEYQDLAKKLMVNVEWLGFLSQSEVAKEWANFDLGVIYSTLDSESFGVSAVEAQACGIPIIVSDVSGLMEVTIPNKTSIVVKRMNERALADAIVKMYHDREQRIEMGIYGRAHVLNNYEINKCFSKINELFMLFLNSSPDS